MLFISIGSAFQFLCSPEQPSTEKSWNMHGSCLSEWCSLVLFSILLNILFKMLSIYLMPVPTSSLQGMAMAFFLLLEKSTLN